MDGEGIDRAAALLAQARTGQARFGRLPDECRPQDEAAAYAVQDALHRHLTAAGRGKVIGHKIGCTTTVMQRYLGIGNPCAGGVFAPTVHHESADLRHVDFLRLGVECEIAVRLGLDLPTEAAPYDRHSVGFAVAACMAAIEIVDDRYQDYRSLDTPTLIADDFFNAGCVLGGPVESWRDLDLATLVGHMLVNDEEVGRGRGGDILGHPLEALAWLANARAGRGTPLRADEFVLLGSVVQTVWLSPGDRVEIEVGKLGGARLTVA